MIPSAIRRAFLCGLALASLCSPAAAEEEREKPKLIEEFLTVEPTYVESRGELQLGAAFDYRRPGRDWRTPALIEYGITDRIELELEGSYLSIPREGARDRGLGDVELGLHYALRPDVDKLAVTLGVAVGFPTGDEDKGLGSGRTDFELLGIAGMSLWRGELHVGGLLEIEEGEAEPALNAGAVLPRGAFRFTLEATVLNASERVRAVEQQLPEEPGESGEGENLWVVVTPGLFHRPSPEIEYGIGVPLGLTSRAPDWGIIGRLTFEFEF